MTDQNKTLNEESTMKIGLPVVAPGDTEAQLDRPTTGEKEGSEDR